MGKVDFQLTDLDRFKTFIAKNIGEAWTTAVDYFGDVVVRKKFVRSGIDYVLLGRFAKDGGYVGITLFKEGDCVVDGRGFDMDFTMDLVKEALGR